MTSQQLPMRVRKNSHDVSLSYYLTAMNGEIILDYLGWPHIINRSLKVEEEGRNVKERNEIKKEEIVKARERPNL